jgi:hypothetical protein
MRDLLNLIDLPLTESRGLGARRPGEEFISDSNPNDKIYVNSVTFYPQNSTAYPTYEEMVDALKELIDSMGNVYLDLIGKFDQKDRAFGIAVFDRAVPGQQLAFVKPYRQIKADPTQNQWDNQRGIPGYKYNSKAAAKTQAGMTPQDILTVQQSDLDANGIVKQIEQKFGVNSPLTLVARGVAAGQQMPITIPAPGDLSFSAFRDYFCELLHPIALQTGQYKGNAADAAKKFLGGAGFADCSINFGTDKTEGLSDSIMVGPDGQKIKISSKGVGGGAAASAKNILDSVDELSKTNPRLAKKHSEVVQLVRDIVQNGQAGAPLMLGVKYKIITEQDAQQIRDLKDLPPKSMEAAKNILGGKIRALALSRSPNDVDNVNLYFHCMAAVAHKVAEHVNDTTNFSDAASEILNNGALIQVTTYATEGPGQWKLERFETHHPGQTVTGVKFSAAKTYYSTGIKGNFTFKILKNGAQPGPDESAEQVINREIPKPKSMTGGRTSIRPKQPDSGKSGSGVGRARQ